VLRRTYRGKSEHQTVNVEMARETQSDTARDVMRLARRGPGGLVDAATYTGLVVTARLAQRLSRDDTWERDESSRER
jgi:hypothetical protein